MKAEAIFGFTDLPHTKEIQRAKPYSGPLPSYVVSRDQQAAKAGLIVTHRFLAGAYAQLASVYTGSSTQIINFSLVCHPESLSLPRTYKRSSMIFFESRSPHGHNSGRLWRTAEDRFAIQIKEGLPDKWEIVAFGVERFDFGDRHYFVGTKDNLLRSGIVIADLFPDESTEEGRLTNGLQNCVDGDRRYYILEETTRLCDGLWSYMRDGEAERAVQAANAEKEQAERAAEENLEAVLKALPPFEPSSMSEGDKYLMRLTRGLSDRNWDFIVRWCERMLASGYRGRKASLKAAQSTKLRLVIDNET